MPNWRNAIKNIIKDELSIVRFDEPLSLYTTFHIGGNAECFIIVNSHKAISNILIYTQKENIPIFVIGKGSKILIPSQGLPGITMKLGNRFDYLLEENNEITVGGATSIQKLIQYTRNLSLSGVEFLYGIPATFAGIVKCNAGAFNKDIGSIIKKIIGINDCGEKIEFYKNQMQFSYRQSNFPDNFIITEGTIQLTPKPQRFILKTQQEYQSIRQNNHPWGFSVGSIFKNPYGSSANKISAGKLIDDVNLKGLHCGDAIVSKKHANFIMNIKHAHFNDVYELIQIIKSKVEREYNIILQEEVQILPKHMEVQKWQNLKKFSV